MNKGLIYKINKDNSNEHFVRLERVVIINKKEYNIFIDSDNLFAALIPIDRPIKVEVALTAFLGKKVSFEFDSKNNKIISIECEE